ncbi:MAG TPA: hypothetical protein VGS11_10940 [Candidatus Bathyarchaeia archaeon]|nr:hypothetical protein [Candidatus Bathyarchaeia archaeon]
MRLRPARVDRGQKWGELKQAWKDYSTAKKRFDTETMKSCANKIRAAQVALEIPVADFDEKGRQRFPMKLNRVKTTQVEPGQAGF